MKYTPISYNEFYLWRRNTTAKYPWKRQYINQEFLKHEMKRIKDMNEWYHNTFLKTDKNKPLGEIAFYTVPVELPTTWKGSIASMGNFNYIGLSALQNSPHTLMIALLDYAKKRPEDYKLINITKSKRGDLVNKRRNIVRPIIIIEEWEPLPSDRVYVDIDCEKRIVQNLIQENLINDKQIALSFQSPIISAPYVDGSIGGISLSAISGSSFFAMELAKTIQLMLPPEYRILNPPKKAYTGIKHIDADGIKFHLADRPYSDNNFVSCGNYNDYSGIARELNKRRNFAGEYSSFSTIIPIVGNFTQIWKELLRNFTATEITLPENLDMLPEADIELLSLRNVIDEDLWLQIVNSRQISPSFNTESDANHINTIERLRKDLDAILADVHKNSTSREFLVRNMIHNVDYNLKRMAQSFARTEDRDTLSESDFNQARNLIVDNFTGFVNNPEFERIKYVLSKKRSDERYSVVQTHIINNRASSTREIFDAVNSTGIFKDIYDLQGSLDWLQKKGFVIVDSDKKYHWVGRS